MLTPRQTLARTAAQKISAYIPRTGMDGMLPAPSIGLVVDESWFRKSAQGDKWSFCLTAGTLCPANQERQ